MSDQPTYFESLPLNVRQVIQGLRGVEVEVSKIQKQLRKEVFALEAKYAASYSQLYEHRKRVIAGTEGVTSGEFASGEAQSKNLDDDYKVLKPAPRGPTLPATRINDYWLHALGSHPGFKSLIKDGDKPALAYLSDIKVTYPTYSGQTPPSFVVEFYFNSNPYFNNSVLKKTYIYKDELGFFGTLLYSHVLADKVQWKPGKNLIEQARNKKQAVANAKDRNKRYNNDDDEDDDDDDEDEVLSFFCYFDPPISITSPEGQAPPKGPSRYGEDDEDDDDDDRDYFLDNDFDLGESIKDRILAHSVEYFTGEAEDYEDVDDDEDVFEGSDDEDDDD